MTAEQLAQFEALKTPEERAAFLLEIGVSAVSLGAFADSDQGSYRAKVGTMMLPIYGATEELAIKRGTDWLREKGGIHVH